MTNNEEKFIKDVKRISRKSADAVKNWWHKAMATGANVKKDAEKPQELDALDVDIAVVRKALWGRARSIYELLGTEQGEKLDMPDALDAFDRIIEQLKR